MPKLSGINHLKAVKALEKVGFSVIRQITIPRNNPINAFTMGGILQDAGLTIEAFRNLL